MLENRKWVSPIEIEKRSFALISQELGDRTFPPEEEAIIKRVIHTTADFEYADTLCFGNRPIAAGLTAIEQGGSIVTDTTMAMSGINKRVLSSFGGKVCCFIGDPDVAEQARQNGVTRSAVAVDKAAIQADIKIYVVGNAPTALIRICELIEQGNIYPDLVIGVPVGFVNVVESKEWLCSLKVPYIVARGRKGGSNVAAAIVNALLYMASGGRRE